MKLAREIEQYQSLSTDVTAMRDLAFNISVTAWALCDWLFGDLTTEQRKRLNLESRSQTYALARRCRALQLCRLAATASKYWEVTQYPDLDVGVIVKAEPHGWRIYFVDGGTHREAGEVFLEVLDFWTSFIYPNEIAQGPQSTAKLIGESGETRPG